MLGVWGVNWAQIAGVFEIDRTTAWRRWSKTSGAETDTAGGTPDLGVSTLSRTLENMLKDGEKNKKRVALHTRRSATLTNVDSSSHQLIRQDDDDL